MATLINVSDLPYSLQSAEMVEVMVAGANARASRVAPCLAAASADQLAEARLVLIGAVKRWIDAGSGVLQSQQAGPFGMTVDTRQRTGYHLWPSEIEQLQDICKNGEPESRTAFSVDTVSTSAFQHAATCSINFGANFCDCGAILAGYPIFGPEAV